MERLKPKIMKTWKCPPKFAWCPALSLGVATGCLLAATVAKGDLEIHVTDEGIGQWNASLYQNWTEKFQPTAQVSDQDLFVFKNLSANKGAQIILPMPPDNVMSAMSSLQLKDLIANQLMDRVATAKAGGVSEFEVRLVQNIDALGYASRDRQDLVKKFGEAAYEAVGVLVDRQTAEHQNVHLDVFAGSNGAVAFTENVGSWASYSNNIKAVTLVDGRAFIDPTRATIQALGVDKVRISNTYGDWPAGDTSIGNLATVQKLVREFPELKAVLLDPTDPSQRMFGRTTEPVTWLSSHIRLLTTPDAKFDVSRVGPDQLRFEGRYNSVDIFNSADLWRKTRNENSTMAATPGGPGVIRDALTSRHTPLPAQDAEQILDQARAYTRGISDIVKSARPGPETPAVGELRDYLKNASDLVDAMQQDVDASKGQPVSLIHSEVLWQVAHFGYDHVLDKLYSAAGVTERRPDFGTFEFARGSIEEMANGHFDINSFEHQMDGIVGLTWGLAGYVGSGGNYRAADIASQAGQQVARMGRDATRELTDTVSNGYGDRILEDYRIYATSGRARAQDVLPIDKWYGPGWDQAKQDLHFSSDYDKLAQDYYSLAVRPAASVKTINVPFNPLNSASSVQDAQFAVSLVQADTRVLMVGSGPLAARMQTELEQQLGSGNVKSVPTVMTANQMNLLASDFKADAIIHLVQPEEHYRNDLPSVKIESASDFSKLLSDPVDHTPKKAPQTFLPPPGGGGGGAGGAVAADNGRRGGPGGPSVTYVPPRPLPAMNPASDAALRNDANTSRPSFDVSAVLPHVGGVMLSGTAKVEQGDAQRSSGDFALIFEGSDGAVDVPTLRRFVTALWATYFTDEGPGISIDPVQGMVKDHVVRYVGDVINSDLGRVMRETDYAMKQWAVGTNKPDISNFLNPDELAARNGVANVGALSRFWFVPENMTFSKADNALLFTAGQMTLKTEYVFEKSGKKSEENEEFAAEVTKRYPEIAAKIPVFAELFEYAKLVSLAKYLKEQRVPLLWFLLANREMVLTENSVGTVKAFAQKSKYFDDINIEGGVDLSPKPEPGRFVMDQGLVDAIADARSQALATSPSTTSTASAPMQILTSNGGSMSVTPAQTVVISESRSRGDNYATDLGLRHNEVPQLELARFRREDFPQVSTFGRDWHLMIPYELHPGSQKTARFNNLMVPQTMVLKNLLTGHEETMVFNTDRYDIAGYVPKDADTSVNIGIFFLTDGTFRLADKLGCEFQFDEGGRLTDMMLSPDYQVSYKYGEKRLGWRDFDVLPFRLEPEGNVQVAFLNGPVPQKLRLFDAANGTEEVFEFTSKNSEGIAGYSPADPQRSGYRFLSLLSDASFLLEHKSGNQIAFDRRGQFSNMIVQTVASMTQGAYDVHFDYALSQNQYRIIAAHISDHQTNQGLYTVNYQFDRVGSLKGSDVVTLQKSPEATSGRIAVNPSENGPLLAKATPVSPIGNKIQIVDSTPALPPH